MARFLLILVLIILLIRLVARPLGGYLLRLWMRHLARRMGADLNQHTAKKQAAHEAPPEAPKKVIPNGVGEYVEYEDLT
ncbi:MAG: hypothetical protein LBS94_01695 [Prevotellaceae bacterium]|jgi:hypothetical protein|nr:hypothetical protein [Prevotellaceae bacterium]